MAKKSQQTPGRTSNPQPQREDLGQTGQERERSRDDERPRTDEDDEVE